MHISQQTCLLNFPHFIEQLLLIFLFKFKVIYMSDKIEIAASMEMASIACHATDSSSSSPLTMSVIIITSDIQKMKVSRRVMDPPRN